MDRNLNHKAYLCLHSAHTYNNKYRNVKNYKYNEWKKSIYFSLFCGNEGDREKTTHNSNIY